MVTRATYFCPLHKIAFTLLGPSFSPFIASSYCPFWADGMRPLFMSPPSAPFLVLPLGISFVGQSTIQPPGEKRRGRERRAFLHRKEGGRTKRERERDKRGGRVFSFFPFFLSPPVLSISSSSSSGLSSLPPHCLTSQYASPRRETKRRSPLRYTTYSTVHCAVAATARRMSRMWDQVEFSLGMHARDRVG